MSRQTAHEQMMAVWDAAVTVTGQTPRDADAATILKLLSRLAACIIGVTAQKSNIPAREILQTFETWVEEDLARGEANPP